MRLERPVLRDLPPTPGELGWATDRGDVRVSEPAPGVFLFVGRGFLTADFVAKIVDVHERAVAQGGRPHIFIDGEFLTGHEPPLRADLTAWVQRHRPRLAAMHVLVRARPVKMAVAVSNLTLGGMLRTYDDRGAFRAALARAVAGARASAPRVLPAPRVGPA